MCCSSREINCMLKCGSVIDTVRIKDAFFRTWLALCLLSASVSSVFKLLLIISVYPANRWKVLDAIFRWLSCVSKTHGWFASCWRTCWRTCLWLFRQMFCLMAWAVRLSSVMTLLHSTQRPELFGNIFAPSNSPWTWIVLKKNSKGF